MSTTTTTTTTPTTAATNINGNDHVHLPYARLESTHFGIYDIWQEKTIVGKKTNRHEVDVNMGSTSVVSRIHFELILVNGSDFQLRCRSKNGVFINNNYTKMSSITVLPKQCTIRFPSTDMCISFSSLINNNNINNNTTTNNNTINRTSPGSVSRHVSTETLQHRSSSSSLSSVPIDTNNPSTTSSLLLQSIPNVTQQQQQQVILVAVNQHPHRTVNQVNNNNNHHHHELNNSLLPISLNIPSSSTSSINSTSTIHNNGHIKIQYENPTTMNITSNTSLLSSTIPSCSTSPKIPNSDIIENQTLVSSPIIQRLPSLGIDNNQQDQDNINSKNSTKPPFSYAQLIVQAILSAPDKQMTLSQIYNFISAQYPYYEANNRGWQNSIRHNLSLNRYFIRLARKENDTGKGSFWRLDETCEEKLIDHAFRHRKQRRNSISFNSSQNDNNLNKSDDGHSPTTQYQNDQTDFLLADIQTSNPSTPLSPMTSPLVGPIIEAISPIRQTEDNKRKRDDDDDDHDNNLQTEQQIEDLLHTLTASIDETVKRQKT